MITSKKYILAEACYKATVKKNGENNTVYVHVIDSNNYVSFSLSFWHSTNERIHCRIYPMGCYDTFDEILEAYIQEVNDFYK